MQNFFDEVFFSALLSSSSPKIGHLSHFTNRHDIYLYIMHSIKYFFYSICCWPKLYKRRCEWSKKNRWIFAYLLLLMIASPIQLKLKTILKLSTRECVCVCACVYISALPVKTTTNIKWKKETTATTTQCVRKMPVSIQETAHKIHCKSINIFFWLIN